MKIRGGPKLISHYICPQGKVRRAQEKVFMEWEILVSKEKDVAQSTKL